MKSGREGLTASDHPKVAPPFVGSDRELPAVLGLPPDDLVLQIPAAGRSTARRGTRLSGPRRPDALGRNGNSGCSPDRFGNRWAANAGRGSADHLLDSSDDERPADRLRPAGRGSYSGQCLAGEDLTYSLDRSRPSAVDTCATNPDSVSGVGHAAKERDQPPSVLRFPHVSAERAAPHYGPVRPSWNRPRIGRLVGRPESWAS